MNYNTQKQAYTLEIHNILHNDEHDEITALYINQTCNILYSADSSGLLVKWSVSEHDILHDDRQHNQFKLPIKDERDLKCYCISHNKIINVMKLKYVLYVKIKIVNKNYVIIVTYHIYAIVIFKMMMMMKMKSKYLFF